MAGAIMAMLAKPKGGASEPDGDEEVAPESKPGGSSAKKLALLAVQAMKDGDDEAAADALVGAMKACATESEAGEYEG